MAKIYVILFARKLNNWYLYLTEVVASRATALRMSAQDTVLGQCFSNSALISFINSKPRNVLLTPAYFSLVSGWSSKIEASHPYNYKFSNLLLPAYIIELFRLLNLGLFQPKFDVYSSFFLIKVSTDFIKKRNLQSFYHTWYQTFGTYLPDLKIWCLFFIKYLIMHKNWFSWTQIEPEKIGKT